MYPGKILEWAEYFATQFISVNNPRRGLLLCGRIPCFLGTTFANQVLYVLVYMQLVTAFTDPCWRTKLKMKVETLIFLSSCLSSGQRRKAILGAQFKSNDNVGEC